MFAASGPGREPVRTRERLQGVDRVRDGIEDRVAVDLCDLDDHEDVDIAADNGASDGSGHARYLNFVPAQLLDIPVHNSDVYWHDKLLPWLDPMSRGSDRCLDRDVARTDFCFGPMFAQPFSWSLWLGLMLAEPAGLRCVNFTDRSSELFKTATRASV